MAVSIVSFVGFPVSGLLQNRGVESTNYMPRVRVTSTEHFAETLTMQCWEKLGFPGLLRQADSVTSASNGFGVWPSGQPFQRHKLRGERKPTVFFCGGGGVEAFLARTQVNRPPLLLVRHIRPFCQILLCFICIAIFSCKRKMNMTSLSRV